MSELVSQNLLTAAERVLGLPLCVHPTAGGAVPPKWRLHRTPPCLAAKRKDRLACNQFDGQRVHQELGHAPDGRIHECPFGFTEIAVPLMHSGRQLGVLFAGPVWARRSKPPHRDLPVVTDRRWLRDRLVLLRAMAGNLAELLAGNFDDDRVTRIRRFLQQNLDQPVTIDQLANHLSLSPSRARHLVKQLFGTPFSKLVQSLKLTEAARLAIITDAPISEIALQVGYEDQNYFTRLFRRQFGTPPSNYRKQFLLEK